MAGEAANSPAPGELTESHRQFCVRVAVSMGCTSPEDCAQVAILRAATALNTFRGSTEAQLHAWLKRIVRNVYLNSVREQEAKKRKPTIATNTPCADGSSRPRPRTEAALPPAVGPISPTPPSSPSVRLRRDEEEQQLQGLISNLSIDEQTVIRLKSFDGVTFKEIAERMGKPLKTVYWIYHRALKNLRSQTRPSQWSKLLS